MAPLVLDAAAEGDEVAATIIRDILKNNEDFKLPAVENPTVTPMVRAPDVDDDERAALKAKRKELKKKKQEEARRRREQAAQAKGR